MFLVAFFLKFIVYGTDIVLSNIYGESCLFVCFVKGAFE